MSTFTRCNQCNGERPAFPFNWIKVKHESVVGVWDVLICPGIGGDYCSFECLLEKISFTIEERDQMEKAILATE